MMTFNDYIQIWNQRHPIAIRIEKRTTEMDDLFEDSLNLNSTIIRKIDWIKYCEHHENVIKPDKDFFDQLFNELLQELTIDICNQNSFNIGSFIIFYNSVNKEDVDK